MLKDTNEEQEDKENLKPKLDQIVTMTEAISLSEPLPFSKEKLDFLQNNSAPQSLSILSEQMRNRINKLQSLSISYEWRLKTFNTTICHENDGETSWPYPHNTKQLNATTLAKAGFIRGSILKQTESGEPDISDLTSFTIEVIDKNDDAVFCPFCFKALSEFESTDNPFNEHKAHQEYCIFIKQLKTPRAKTSLWKDPLNLKPPKTSLANTLTIQDIANMKTTIRTAHQKMIQYEIDNYLEGHESVYSDKVASDFCMGTTRARCSKKSSLQKLSVKTKEYIVSSDQISSAQRTKPMSIDAIPYLQMNDLQNRMWNEGLFKKTGNSYNKMNLTPMGNFKGNNTTVNPNQTLSMPLSSIQNMSTLNVQSDFKVAQSPGNLEMGGFKTIYLIQNGRVLSLKVPINKENIRVLERL